MDNSNETVSSQIGESLRRKIGEGSFVGFKKINKPEELVEWLKHLSAYRWAQGFAAGKSVLDVGCGVGYGACELSVSASTVVGIDFWKEGLCHCHKKYGRQVSPLMASGIRFPFRDDSFDLVVSFQVIEHIDPKEVATYLTEIRRVLKTGGTFLVATPNRLLRLLPLQRPWNPDHKEEYSPKELKALLEKIFGRVKIMGLSASKEAYLIEYKRVKQSPFHKYLINPAGTMARYALPRSVKAKLKFAKRTSGARSFIGNVAADGFRFLLSDFRIISENLNSSIDIYGICIKTEGEDA